jgi:hypothetical protein
MINELTREERWFIFKQRHNNNGWTMPWDRMVFPSHEFFDKYTKVYRTDISICIPKTVEECTEEDRLIVSILRHNKIYENSSRMASRTTCKEA